MKKLTTEEFIQRAVDVHGDKYGYSGVVYVNSRTKVKIWCNTCEKFFLQRPNDHFQGKGCKCNKLKRRLTKKMFVYKAKKVHGNKYDYSKTEYINTRNKVNIICNKCKKEFYQNVGHHIYRKQGCPDCISSNGENIIKTILDKKNIIYIREKRFVNCRNKQPLPFDFYLPENNICIEYQGRQHYQPEYFGKGEISKKELNDIFNLQKNKDMIKKDYCENNNINLIEIPYWEYKNIDKILNEVI